MEAQARKYDNIFWAAETAFDEMASAPSTVARAVELGVGILPIVMEAGGHADRDDVDELAGAEQHQRLTRCETGVDVDQQPGPLAVGAEHIGARGRRGEQMRGEEQA